MRKKLILKQFVDGGSHKRKLKLAFEELERGLEGITKENLASYKGGSSGDTGISSEYWIWGADSGWTWMGCGEPDYNAPHYGSDLEEIIVSSSGTVISRTVAPGYISTTTAMSYNQGYELAGSLGTLSDILMAVYGFQAGVMSSGTAIPSALLAYANSQHNGNIQDAIHYLREGNIIVERAEIFSSSGFDSATYTFTSADGLHLGTITL
ncbi:hypothetical protein [Niabella drilacis]|uniref:Uncharacterized protein n=1 Tax=Niabella drilacis (strain DSM 25811 / CCM 8410 / CCUG 62505 / LMG 26954 / E90) TaxID=1285928 RepID=A0A1G6V1A0_NIADE|nr:hypothetical protein [Niabella drilacis]SDD47302.1 hypothetical protein SAMN04487894_109157 [Niabella drilacis]